LRAWLGFALGRPNDLGEAKKRGRGVEAKKKCFLQLFHAKALSFYFVLKPANLQSVSLRGKYDFVGQKSAKTRT